MKLLRKITPTSITIFLIIIISLCVWLYSKTSFILFKYTPWLYVAQGLGMISIVLISLNFILATRLKLFRVIFGNLEEVYHVHKKVGIAGVLFGVLHLLAFAVHSIFFPALFSFYFIPGTYWSLNFGRAGLLLFIALAGITFIKWIPYHIWKKTHQYMGFALILTFLHVWTVNSDVSKDMMLRSWTVGWMSLGVVSFLYIRFLYPYLGKRHIHVIKEINQLKGNVHQIRMEPEAKPLKYSPAQYIFVSFLSQDVGEESHPFTITSIMESGMLEICAKEIGDHTRKFGKLTVGTKVKVWGPYGSFAHEFLRDKHEQVWIGGGIGVTPFLGMLLHHVEHPTKAKKWFFYCCRARDEASFDSFIMEKAHNHNITLIEHYSDNQGFLTIEFFKEHLPNLKNKKFLVCGPPIMKSLVIEFLIKDGVSPRDIIQEDFGFR